MESHLVFSVDGVEHWLLYPRTLHLPDLNVYRKENHMRTSVGERLQAATGLVFVLLSLIALFAMPPRPAPGAPANEIALYYTAHSGAAKAADYLFLLRLLFALWFIGYLRTVFAQAEGELHRLSTLFFGSGVAVVAVGMVFWGMGLALPGQAADLGVIKALSEVVTFGISITFLLDFLHVGTASVLVLRTGVLPRWVGVFGVVVAVVQVLGSLSLVTNSSFFAVGGPFALLAFVVFLLDILVVSIILIVKAGSGKAVGTSSATA
jgi:hypothetical protein